MTSQPPSTSTPSDGTATPPRRTTVLIGILLTTALAGLVLGLLSYRALTSPEPDRVLFVRADRDWDGVELSVEGGPLAAPRVTAIEALGHYSVPFFLWPGQYTLRVRSQGVQVLAEEVDLRDAKQVEIDLTRSGATTRPATRPASGFTTQPD